MKFNMNRRFALLSLAALLALGGCSEWTDMESVTIKEPQVEKSEAYMQAIRDYKASEHKVLIGWFDNVALPGDRSQHLTVLPDSIDIVVLQHPELITEALAAEAAEIRTRMGTRTLCSVSFAELEAAFEAQQQTTPAADESGEEGGDEGSGQEGGDGGDEGGEQPQEPAADAFTLFCNDYVARVMALCDTWALDGVSVVYDGRSTTQMPDAEKESYLSRQQAFLAAVAAWRTAHPDRMLLFEGTPQYLADASLLEGCDYIILKMFTQTTVADLDRALRLALTDNVPSDRIVIGVESWPLDAADTKTGRFQTEEGKEGRAVIEVARWMNRYDAGCSKSGLAVNHLQYDYFNPYRIYQYTREAIGLMNYAPKTTTEL